jgi:hypothetical protein
MKTRLERVESLLSASRRDVTDQQQVTPMLSIASPVAGQVAREDETSFCLIDGLGFSSFIGNSPIFYQPRTVLPLTIALV